MIRSIGDRMKYESKSGWMVWEVIVINLYNYEAICVDNGYSGWNVGDFATWSFTEQGTGNWTFIGNYSKQDNFTTLYDLMNE